MAEFTEIVRVCGYAIEVAGVLAILAGSLLGAYRFLRSLRRGPLDEAYNEFRRDLGRSILLGLEFLIAGDLISTVIVDATLRNIAILGLIILIRTFLGITLHLEVEGRWPWQGPAGSPPGRAP